MDAGYYKIDLSEFKFTKSDYDDLYYTSDGGVKVTFSRFWGNSDKISYRKHTVKDYLDQFYPGHAFRIKDSNMLIFKTYKGWIDSEGNKFDVENDDLSTYDFEEL